MLISEYDHAVARAATTSDVFNAVAEPARRGVLGVLADGERPVGDIVTALGLAQPQVSKHLMVLRDVDLVRSRPAGRQRLYRLNGLALRPIHDWVSGFERHWNDRLDRLDSLLIDLQREGRES
jgi:DNA-binding transcriptional ArsR family regulator